MRAFRRGWRRFSRRGRLTLVACGILFVAIPLLCVGLLSLQTPDEDLSPWALSIFEPPNAQLEPVPAAVLAHLPVGVVDYQSHRSEAGAEMASPLPVSGRYGAYRIDYSFDAELTERILAVLERGRVKRGHVIALDPRTGRILAYVSTDPEGFPAGNPYPAASLIKVVTAAAALETAPELARRPCLYRGNPYRLTPSRVHRPPRGNTASLETALASSNNQCFAQLAVDAVGSEALLSSLDRFGWLESPAAGHAAGRVDAGDDAYALGRLGSGLAGARITPLHSAQLAATLATGERVEPWWVDRVVDGDGRVLALPARGARERIISGEHAEELRSMLVRTTTHGTARSAFRDRRGRPKLRHIKVAGKTGNLSGDLPKGRYEWFIGVAPAADPSIAISVVQVQGNLWWSKSSELAAEVLEEIFCDSGHCDPTLADRFTGELGATTAPVLLSDPLAQTSRP
jgi:cell division protein FtsI/penicillin-binding protein 2